MAAPKIVIADDDRITRTVLQKILHDAGFWVVAQAENGAEVVTLCAHHKPDVLFLDINMPKLNGFDALAALRGVLPNLPVVMLSATSTVENIRMSAKFGVCGFLVKPFTPEKVMNAMKAAKLTN